jgi:2-dehydro-3-deoxyglucarate aldolase
MEHAPNDSGDVTGQLRAIAAAHLPSEPVVRVPASEEWLVKRVLDAGARTLMFPNIETAEEAAHAVRLTAISDADALEGLRGVAGAVRGGSYGMRRDYVQNANAQIATIVQIESAQARARSGEDCRHAGRRLPVHRTRRSRREPRSSGRLEASGRAGCDDAT